MITKTGIIHSPQSPNTRRLSQARLAARTGITESIITEVLAGKRKLTRGQIGKLARYFHVEPGILLSAGP